ncbi:MAG: hypothetical protein EBT33_21430, partial [Betaproteobacteria bacterium]|nr:hypothetical protein [Betaproteobacteria bacterium]
MSTGMDAASLLPVVDLGAMDAASRRDALSRPAADDRAEVLELVRGTVREVRARGDAAVLDFARRFDGGAPERLRIAPAELDIALSSLPAVEREALERAIDNVSRFHAAQLPPPLVVETMPGVRCERITRPLDSVGLYVPGGSAPLPSALIMSAVPAALAGVRRRVLCTPARGGQVHPSILATARLCGIPTTRLKVMVYALAGCFFGAAGLFQLSRLRQGDPTVAVGLELDI